MKNARVFAAPQAAGIAAVAAALALAIGFSLGNSAGYAEGETAGYTEGRAAGDRVGWNRGAAASFEKAYWMGIVDGCRAVFDSAGWQYLFVNGGGILDKSTYCVDNGDHSATPEGPETEVPYVPESGDSQ
jgi:hypothetical protein